MPFGLANALAIFQSLINKFLEERLDIFCIVYLEDILINKSKKRVKHKEAVRLVLKKLPKYSLYANFKTYRFSSDEVHFLGYIVSLSEVYMEPKRIENIKNWPEAQSIWEIQVFIGFANFYRLFIRNFSAIAGPFTWMLKTDLYSCFLNWHKEYCQINQARFNLIFDSGSQGFILKVEEGLLWEAYLAIFLFV